MIILPRLFFSFLAERNSCLIIISLCDSWYVLFVCVHLTLKNLQKINAEDKERKKKQMFLHGMLAHLEIPDTPEQPDVFHFRIVVVVYVSGIHTCLFLS